MLAVAPARVALTRLARLHLNVHMSETGIPFSETPELTYLGRLLDTIEAIAGGVSASSYRDAAQAFAVPPSTAHRLLSLLIERGYCERAEDGRFLPGSRLFRIGVQVLEQLPQWEAAKKVVSELGQVTGESISFGLVIGDEIVLIARHNSSQMLTAVAHVGDILSPHTSALGKAVLANAAPHKRWSLLDRFAPGSADEILRTLSEELEQVAERGYSVDEETYAPGMRCRAVPVVDYNCGMLGGLSVSGPAVRFTESRAKSTVPQLKEAADRLVNTPTAASRTRHATHITRNTGQR